MREESSIWDIITNSNSLDCNRHSVKMNQIKLNWILAFIITYKKIKI